MNTYQITNFLFAVFYEVAFSVYLIALLLLHVKFVDL